MSLLTRTCLLGCGLLALISHAAVAQPARDCLAGAWKTTGETERAYINPETGLLEYQPTYSEGENLSRVGFQAGIQDLKPGTYDLIVDIGIGRIQTRGVVKLQLATQNGSHDLASKPFPASAKAARLRKQVTIDGGTIYAILETKADTKTWFFAEPLKACRVQ